MTANMPKMSKRAQQALEVLANGGRYLHQLERDSYTGREQFQHRLSYKTTAYSAPIKGFGAATFFELQDLGLLECDYRNIRSATFKLKAA